MAKLSLGAVDLTKGTPWKQILIFTLPMLIGNIAQQLYSTVDTIVVGNYASNGDNAIAAISSALPILNMMLVLFIGISAGASVMVAQYFGAKKRHSLSVTVGNCITATAIATVFLMAVLSPFIKQILMLLNTPDEILLDCYRYLMISLIGIAGMAFYNILSGILRGLGDSLSALIYLLVATVINIALDIFFVATLDMGVAGVALATVIAQFISSALCLIKLARMREYFDFGLKYLKPSAEHIKILIKLGLPSGITQAIISSAMIIVQSLTNSFGPEFIAANGIIMRVDGFAMMPNFSFGMGLTTYAGQNVGAGLYDRVKKGAKQGAFMAVLCSTAITVIILLFGKYLMRAFTDTAELVNLSYNLMMILAVGYIAMAVTQSLSGIMRGAGDTMTPMWISLITTVAARVPIAYGISYLTSTELRVFEKVVSGEIIKYEKIMHSPWFLRNIEATELLPHGRKECIQISLLCSWILGAVLTFIFYKRGKWKNTSI